MNVYATKLMDVDYVLALGAWWGVIVFLSVLVEAMRHAIARHGQHGGEERPRTIAGGQMGA